MVLAVAAGGAIGAACRYLAIVQATRWFGIGFPWGTFAVNILGCFAMGLLAAAFAYGVSASQEVRALVATGILGGFTTFSAFSLDAVALAERGAWVSAASYIAGSVMLGIGAFLGGLHLWRVLAP